MRHIYQIKDSLDGNIVYLGSTIDPVRREASHRQHTETALGGWLAKTPEALFSVIGIVENDAKGFKYEHRLIARLKPKFNANGLTYSK